MTDRTGRFSHDPALALEAGGQSRSLASSRRLAPLLPERRRSTSPPPCRRPFTRPFNMMPAAVMVNLRKAGALARDGTPVPLPPRPGSRRVRDTRPRSPDLRNHPLERSTSCARSCLPRAELPAAAVARTAAALRPPLSAIAVGQWSAEGRPALGRPPHGPPLPTNASGGPSARRGWREPLGAGGAGGERRGPGPGGRTLRASDVGGECHVAWGERPLWQRSAIIGDGRKPEEPFRGSSRPGI